MKDQNRVRDQPWMSIEWERVPRLSAIVFAVFAHLVALPLIFLLGRAERVHILPEEHKSAQTISGAAYLSFNSPNSKHTRLHAQPHAEPPAEPPAHPARLHRSTPPARVPESRPVAQGAPTQTLREQARQATAAITRDLRFRQVYGFSPNHDYQLAVQTAGQIPSISADAVPPHFEQYVIVEVTIDVDGHVAEALIVAGMVTPTIERTLLSAIREFKYSPAKRDGVPIPSQRDIVIHIPS
jgi:TonB family protein